MEPANHVSGEGVQDLLNRMVPDPATYEVLVQELVALVMDGAEGRGEALRDMADRLHRKAVAGDDMMNVYADCARDVVRLVKKRRGAFRDFSNALIARCKATFEALEVLKMDDESEYQEDKAQKLGNMQFIGELYNRCVIPQEPVRGMLDKLTGVGSDLPPSTDNVEALRVFLLATPPSGDQLIEHVVASVRALQQEHPSERVKRLLGECLDAHSGASSHAAGEGAAAVPPPPPPPAQQTSSSQHLKTPTPAALEHTTSSYHDSPTTPTDYNGYLSGSQNASFDLNRSVSCGEGGTPLSTSMGGYYPGGPSTPLQHPHGAGGPPKERNRKKDVKLYQLQQAARRERTVYVVGIDASLSEGELLSFIAQCGQLVKVRLCGDTTNRTIYGFFEFETKEGAECLVGKTGSTLGGYIIHCSFARQAIRDLSHGQADSKIRTLNFDQKPQLGDSCRDSILNDPQWYSSKQRNGGYRKGGGGGGGADMHRQTSGPMSGPSTPLQPGISVGAPPPPQVTSPLTPSSYHSNQNAWDANAPTAPRGGDEMSSPEATQMHMPPPSGTHHHAPGAAGGGAPPRPAVHHAHPPAQSSTQVNSLPQAVRHMAQTHTPPAGLSCHLGDMGAVAVSNTAIGAGEWGDIVGYVPAFLRAVEKIFRVEALQVLLDGAEHFLNVLNSQHIPTQNVFIAWSRFAYMIALCLKAEIVSVEGTAQLVHQLTYTDQSTWLQFSTELSNNLLSSGYDYSVVSEIIPQM